MIVGSKGGIGSSKMKQLARKKPITKVDENGDTYLLGFERKKRSRKSHQTQMYKTPLKIASKDVDKSVDQIEHMGSETTHVKIK